MASRKAFKMFEQEAMGGGLLPIYGDDISSKSINWPGKKKKYKDKHRGWSVVGFNKVPDTSKLDQFHGLRRSLEDVGLNSDANVIWQTESDKFIEDDPDIKAHIINIDDDASMPEDDEALKKLGYEGTYEDGNVTYKGLDMLRDTGSEYQAKDIRPIKPVLALKDLIHPDKRLEEDAKVQESYNNQEMADYIRSLKTGEKGTLVQERQEYVPIVPKDATKEERLAFYRDLRKKGFNPYELFRLSLLSNPEHGDKVSSYKLAKLDAIRKIAEEAFKHYDDYVSDKETKNVK